MIATLLGNKEKTIKIHAENFLWGNLAFDYGLTEDERMALAGSSGDLSKAFTKWLRDEEKNPNSDEHKKETEILYYMIFGWHVRGRLKGVLRDVDLELENTKLKDEVMRFKLQNEELRKDNITLATELKDKTGMLEKYEKATKGKTY